MTERLRKHSYLLLLSLAVTLLFAAYSSPLLRPAWLERFEYLTYDLRLRLTLPGTRDPRIVIVDIDEKSLKAEGRWPWPRDRLAALVDILFDQYGIRLLAFDVVFAERDRNPGIERLRAMASSNDPGDQRFLERLDRYEREVDRDARFAASLEGRPVVLGYYFQNDFNVNAGSQTGELPQPILPVKEAGLSRLPLPTALGYGANIAALQRSALAAGFFDNPRQDDDGVIRAVPMLVNYEGNLYEALSLAVLRVAADAWFIQPVIDSDAQGEARGLDALAIGDFVLPVDDRAMALVPYRGGQGSFPYVSIADVLTGKAPEDVLRNAIVMVGATSPGLQDLRATPMQATFPGVEIHANLLSGMLDGSIRYQPSYAIAIEVAQMVLIGLCLTVLFPWLTAAWSIVMTLLLLSTTIALNMFAWYQGLVLPLSTSLLLIVALFTLHMAYGFITETRMKHSISQVFGQYVPPELVDEMVEQPQALDMTGASREMTVMFSDVRGFTSISEGLSPAELSRLMNAMLTPMTRIIHGHRGTIDKYMGDAIMAFWGAPLADSTHAVNALTAALEMVHALPDLQRAFEQRGWPPIEIGIGLNTGEMSVGNMGSEFRIAYTVLGDAVNLGSRLEGLTKVYGVRLIVSESTHAAAPMFVYRELDRVRVKGKDDPVTIYEPLGLADDLDEAVFDELGKYDVALQSYRAMRWEEARQRFAALALQYPGRYLYTVYLERLRHYRAMPPLPDWDGVFRFDSK